HSQGDLPSVRRLKREIELIDRENEEKRAQKKLFDEGEKIAGTPGKALSGNDGSGATSSASAPVDERAQLYADAVEYAEKFGRVSSSLLQRNLNIGFDSATELLEMMEKAGAIGPADGVKPRPFIPPHKRVAQPPSAVQTSAPPG